MKYQSKKTIAQSIVFLYIVYVDKQKEIKMSDLKIRCSSLPKIMTQPKLKADKDAGKLSETAKSYIEELFISYRYGRSKYTSNKYTNKGIVVEQDSIDLYNRLNGTEFVKNSLCYQNEFITGTPDIIASNAVIDIKSSWDIFTFPMFNDDAWKDYYWQMQGYMMLTGKEVAKVVYCLTNADDDTIFGEAKKLYYNQGIEEAIEIKRAELTYDDIIDSERVREFIVFRSQEDINKISEQVEKCRVYYKKIGK